MLSINDYQSLDIHIMALCVECLRDFNFFADFIYADGFEELHALIVLCPTRHDKAVHDKSMACGHTEDSMIPFDSA
eukprot:641158-Pleurochrysis_carterae.AAC.4